jgi:hypothetical protein
MMLRAPSADVIFNSYCSHGTAAIGPDRAGPNCDCDPSSRHPLLSVYSGPAAEIGSWLTLSWAGSLQLPSDSSSSRPSPSDSASDSESITSDAGASRRCYSRNNVLVRLPSLAQATLSPAGVARLGASSSSWPVGLCRRSDRCRGCGCCRGSCFVIQNREAEAIWKVGPFYITNPACFHSFAEGEGDCVIV